MTVNGGLQSCCLLISDRLTTRVSHYVVRLVIFVGVAEYLDLLIICNEHPFLFKFILLAEALCASLAKADVVVTDLGPRLEKRRYRATHDDLNGNGLVILLVLPNGAC